MSLLGNFSFFSIHVYVNNTTKILGHTYINDPYLNK